MCVFSVGGNLHYVFPDFDINSGRSIRMLERIIPSHLLKSGSVAMNYDTRLGFPLCFTQKLGHSEMHTLKAWNIKKNGTM
jgi:hypothetical protein